MIFSFTIKQLNTLYRLSINSYLILLFMRNALGLLLIILFTQVVCLAQYSALSEALQKFNTEARKIQPWNKTSFIENKEEQMPLQSGIRQYLTKFHNTSFPEQFSAKAILSDSMLIIGAVPGDSLIITGNWTCTVDILVFGDGKLRFKNANATLLGNLYVWGETAEITADSSTLYIPQQYFYQRTILAAGAGKVRFSHVTLDFSGLSHNIVAADSSTFDFEDVTKIGFSTNGVSEKARYFINGTNLAGEFVIEDDCQLDFKNAKTVLLWHVVPQTGMFHFSFPPSGHVTTYNFNPQLPGIANVGYQIKLENCFDVMWAMMPADNSDVDIQDSEIRAIGLWFLAPDSVNVNGLVNNTTYTNYTASLSDRNLRLRNTSVQTWSLYSMKESKISVSGCILGEIGSMGTSRVTANSVFVDGSGGFMWANDTSFFIAFQTPLTTHVRSDRNGIMIYAYSPLSSGSALAIGNSTLMTIQCSLPEEPVALDNASVWNINIMSPSSGNSNSIIPIMGYALIDRTPTSTNPDMGWYQVFYSLPENDSLVAITPKINAQKRNDTLANWNTSGLKAGQYLLHIFVSSDTEPPVIVEAVRSFSLNPGVFGITHIFAPALKVFPNPVSEVLHFDFPFSNSEVTIISSSGSVIYQENLKGNSGNIDVSAFAPGLYLLKLFHAEGISVTRFIKK